MVHSIHFMVKIYNKYGKMLDKLWPEGIYKLSLALTHRSSIRVYKVPHSVMGEKRVDNPENFN